VLLGKFYGSKHIPEKESVELLDSIMAGRQGVGVSGEESLVMKKRRKQKTKNCCKKKETRKLWKLGGKFGKKGTREKKIPKGYTREI